MPSHELIRYRLLARPPFTVAFPSVVYEISVEPVTGAPVWALWARAQAGRPVWMLCQAGESCENLEREIYSAFGFERLRPSGPSVILDQMCADGRAEITWPHERTKAFTVGPLAHGHHKTKSW